jgi:hypothetical protein
MKKFVLVFVLAVATFAIVGVGAQEDWWYISGREGGARARDNTLRLNRGESYVYLYFRGGMPGADFDKIQLNFTIDKPIEVTWQAFYGPNALVLGSGELIGTIDKGPVETDFESFTLVWSGRGPRNNSTMVGMCLKVNVPSGTANFTMTDVKFLGLKK